MKENKQQTNEDSIMKKIKNILRISAVAWAAVMAGPGPAGAATSYVAYDITPSGVQWAVANCVDGTHIGGCTLLSQNAGYDLQHFKNFTNPYVWTVTGANTVNTATKVTAPNHDAGNIACISGGYAGYNIAQVIAAVYPWYQDLSYTPNSPYTPVGPFNASPLEPNDQNPLGNQTGVVLGTDGHFFVGCDHIHPGLFFPSATSNTGWDAEDLITSNNNLFASNPTLVATFYTNNATTYANAIDGGKVVGQAFWVVSGRRINDAVCWNINSDGSVHDVVDLTLSGAIANGNKGNAEALGVRGDLIVGDWYGPGGANAHAYLWYGPYTNQISGLSLELHPEADTGQSWATGVSKARNEVVGGFQSSSFGGKCYAYVWNLPSDEASWATYTSAPTNWMVDLNSFLPPGITWSNSVALAIDDQGDIVGYANCPTDLSTHAILWVPVATPPAAPTGLQAVGGCEQVTLSWSPSTSATSYNVKRSATSGGSYTPIASGVTTTNYTDNTGLSSDNTPYYYVVSAVGAAGEGGNSGQVSATTAPQAPARLSAVDGKDQIVLTWVASPGAASYNIIRQAGSFWPSIATGLTTLAFTNTGLPSGTTYNYMVAAVNSGNASCFSAVSATTTGPTAPTGLHLSSDGTKVYLGWDVDPSATSYNLKCSTTSGAEVTLTNVTGTSFVDSGLTSALTYYYVVSATNSTGESDNSSEVSIAMPVFAPPLAPAGLQAVGGSGQIVLAWTATAGASGYNVKRSTTSGGEPATPIASVSVNYYTNSGLASGTTYYYVISATNSYGAGPNSSEASATTIPAAPTGLQIVNSNGQFTLTWTAAAGATSYNVKIATNSDGTYVTEGAVLTPVWIYYRYWNWLNAGTTYYFEVSAVNAAGESANSIWVSATTPPPAPTGITAVGGNGQVTLSWTAVTNVTSYKVYRSPLDINLSQGAFTTNIANPTTTDYIDTNVVNGYLYYYDVSAVNGNGEGAPSSGEASAMPTVNLVTNGGFETGDFTGWTPGNDTEVFIGNGSDGISPHSGTFLAELIVGSLSETLTTTPGAKYVISFWVNNFFGDPNQFQVSWNGSTVFGPTSITATGWTNILIQVTATGASTALHFEFEDDYNFLGLDDVSVGLSASLTPPPAPTGLQAVAGNGQITLTWNASPGAVYYMVLRGTNSNGEGGLIATLATNYTDTYMITNGVKYYYIVAAQNNSGLGMRSSEVSATPGAATVPTPPKLGGLTFTRGGGGGCSFSFTNAPSCGFTVYATTNLALPFSNWPVVGQMTETNNGSYSQYQFTDSQASNKVQRFYRVSSP